jgi:hypothetical protein
MCGLTVLVWSSADASLGTSNTPGVSWENNHIVYPVSTPDPDNHPPFTPVLAQAPQCVDLVHNLCVFVIGPNPADPDNNPVTWNYEWFVRTPGTGGQYLPDEQVYPWNHNTSCVPMSHLHVDDEWRVSVVAVDNGNLQSPTPAILSFPIVVANCTCVPFIPDGIRVTESYCITLEDDFYTMSVIGGSGELPVLTVRPGCDVPCDNAGCTPGDTSQLQITIFWDYVELNYTGPCGCFCLTFDRFLPVELISFDAHSVGSEIVVNWATASETNHDRFLLERSYEGEGWERVGVVQSEGSAALGHTYSYRDNPSMEGSYRYRLSGVGINGTVEVYPHIASVNYSRNSELPQGFALEQNYPNPFNPETTIQYSLADASEAKLTIFAVDGREVKTLINGFQSAGTHTVRFDARALPSGVYFYRLEAGSEIAIKKMMLLK